MTQRESVAHWLRVMADDLEGIANRPDGVRCPGRVLTHDAGLHRRRSEISDTLRQGGVVARVRREDTSETLAASVADLAWILACTDEDDLR